MSMHTKGPWRWSSSYETIDGRPTWSLVGEADGYGILSCDGEENSPQGMNDDANARLIAAAPELLEALIAAVECGIVPTSSAREGGANKHVRQLHVADMMRDAIAKAKGESA